MKKIIVSGLVFILFVSISPIFAAEKTDPLQKQTYLELGSLMYGVSLRIWCLGVSKDFPVKGRMVLSPELTLIGSGLEILATPALTVNFWGKDFFVGAGLGAMFPFILPDSEGGTTFPMLKFQAGLKLGKIKFSFYILRGWNSPYASDLKEVVGISLGIPLKKRKNW